MRTKTGKLMVLGLGVCLAAQATWAQGSLTPPGAPAPTMKTLEQIEPRQWIAATGYTITQPGSYYLATNLITGVDITGIWISTNDVTVDLNGFSILGASGTGHGISIASGCKNILVRNGTIRDSYNYGIYAANAAHCAFEDLRILNNGRASSLYDGLRAGKFAKVVNCRLEGNGGEGLVVGDAGEVRGCTIVSNTDGLVVGGNSRIEGNTITDNADNGLRVTGSGSYVADNIVKGNADNYDLVAGNQLNLLLCEIPETLDWPCSVRLAGTLTCAQTATHGITVNANDVTIDMAGHTLVGPGTSSGYGIYQDDALRNMRVFNGKVVNWRGSTNSGVYAMGTSANIENVHATTNYDGIVAGYGSTLSGCTAQHNQHHGISAYNQSTLSGCSARRNGNIGIFSYGGGTLNGCASGNNGGDGIYAGSGSTLRGCAAEFNGGDGLNAGSSSVLSDCVAFQNTGDGIEASDGCSLRGCAAQLNTGDGIRVGDGSTLGGCAVRHNRGDGVKVFSSGCQVLNNQCMNNGYLTGDGSGIHVYGNDNRIDGNNMTDNDRGLEVYGAGNLIVRNSASGNDTNWVIAVSNVCLIVEAATTTNAISGDSGGISPGSSNPSANFTY